MGWVHKVPYVHPHYSCQKPRWDKSFGIGSRWKCDECNRIWIFKGRSDDQRDPYDMWEEYKPSTSSYMDR